MGQYVTSDNLTRSDKCSWIQYKTIIFLTIHELLLLLLLLNDLQLYFVILKLEWKVVYELEHFLLNIMRIRLID